MSSSPDDFVWRFRLDEKPLQPVYDEPLLELTRVQWEELLKLCIPMHGDQPVKVDGFALMRDPGRILPIFADDRRLVGAPPIPLCRTGEEGSD